MTTATRQLSSSLSHGTLPDSWRETHPCDLPLAAWASDLTARVVALQKYIPLLHCHDDSTGEQEIKRGKGGETKSTRQGQGKGSTGKEIGSSSSSVVYWLGGMIAPDAFLAATRQVTAHTHGWSLEDLELHLEVGE